MRFTLDPDHGALATALTFDADPDQTLALSVADAGPVVHLKRSVYDLTKLAPVPPHGVKL